LHDSGGVQDAGSRLAPWAREDDPYPPARIEYPKVPPRLRERDRERESDRERAMYPKVPPDLRERERERERARATESARERERDVPQGASPPERESAIEREKARERESDREREMRPVLARGSRPLWTCHPEGASRPRTLLFGDTIPCRMTGVTLRLLSRSSGRDYGEVTPVIIHGTVSLRGPIT